MFKMKKNSKADDRVEERFQTIVKLVKDLDKKEFKILMEGIDLAWRGYDKVRRAKTTYEKEIEDIEHAEKLLDE